MPRLFRLISINFTLARFGLDEIVLSMHFFRPLYLLGAINPSGTVRLHVSRFLHVTVDVRFQAGREALVNEPPEHILSEIRLPPRFDLNIQRLTRSGELHYFDHPAFGVLVLVTPEVEEPVAEGDDLAPAA